MRKVVEHPDFTAAADALGVGIKRLDEVLHGATWTIARTPEKYAAVPGTNSLRMVAIPPALDVPGLRLWFTHTDEEATLLLLEEDSSADGADEDEE